jgi:hypothetical protein
MADALAQARTDLKRATNTSNFKPVVKGRNKYCCATDGTCRLNNTELPCGGKETGYRDADAIDDEAIGDDEDGIVFDGFIDAHDDSNMHLILQKVLYYVAPGYALPRIWSHHRSPFLAVMLLGTL